MDRHLNPRYGQVILVSEYLFWQLSIDHNIDVEYVQYQFSCAPKLARKCEIEHCFPCGADGRAGSGRVRSRDYQIFCDRWVDLLSYGALLARASRTWSSAIMVQSHSYFNYDLLSFVQPIAT